MRERCHPNGAAWTRSFLRGGLTVALMALVAALPAGAGAQTERPLVRVQLHWLHQAQFAGLYVADALGFYEREGIQVEFAPGGPDVEPLAVLEQGRADVAIGWLSGAMEAREKGADVVNIAQLFKRPATTLVCRRDAGIRRPADVKGKRIGVWNLGDQYDVAFWLRHNRLTVADVNLVPQIADAADLIERRVDCATAMTYNEYGTILASGLSPTDLFVVRFADENFGFLEDGLYSRGATLFDPVKLDHLARFLRASAAGWRHADQNRDEAVSITLNFAPLAEPARQRRMLDAVLQLAEPQRRFGFLEVRDYERSVEIVGLGRNDRKRVEAAAHGGWTHRVRDAAGLDGDVKNPLTEAVRHYLSKAVDSTWFFLLDLIGTAAFGLSGFMRARQRKYDLWGAFILTLLPAVGGGTLRDLLVGGDRHPPFIFKDPTYLHVVLGVIIVGTVLSRLLPADAADSRTFNRALAVFDTIGLATFTVIGAKVALIAGLAWYWVPICSALTCAGGGTLLDIVTGREPHTFQGEPYEEIGIAGGLFLFLCLLLANHFEHTEWIVSAAILATLAGTFTLRMLVIRYDLRSYRLGRLRPRRARTG